MVSPQSLRILLIADADPLNISVLQEMPALDYDIKVAANGREIIRRTLSSQTSALKLLSTRIPSADGYSVCKKLKAEKRVQNDIPTGSRA